MKSTSIPSVLLGYNAECLSNTIISSLLQLVLYVLPGYWMEVTVPQELVGCKLG